MYPTLLIHSWNRWVVLSLLTALGLAYRGWLNRRPYGPANGVSSSVLIGAPHSQPLLGLLLYSALSPWPPLTFRNWGAGRFGSTLRFWAVQPIGLLLSGILLAQIGHSLAKRAATGAARHRRSASFLSLAPGLILRGVPVASRSWFRG